MSNHVWLVFSLFVMAAFFGTMIYATYRGIRDGRRLPPMSRSRYRHVALRLFISPFLIMLGAGGLAAIGLIFIPPLFLLVMPFIHYEVTKSGVRRLSDIQGRPYRCIWRAILSYHPMFMIYLCQRRGNGIDPIDPDIF